MVLKFHGGPMDGHVIEDGQILLGHDFCELDGDRNPIRHRYEFSDYGIDAAYYQFTGTEPIEYKREGSVRCLDCDWTKTSPRYKLLAGMHELCFGHRVIPADCEEGFSTVDGKEY